MTVDELVEALTPIANGSHDAPDENVRLASGILATLLGCLTVDDDDAVDREALRALSWSAFQICQHRLGEHEG